MTEPAEVDGDDGFAAACAVDRSFLGLELIDERRSSFRLTRELSRHDGKLYGGTAVAAAIALAEHASGRRSLWTTVQFVSGAAYIGDRIDCEVAVLAAGRRTTQLRVTAHHDDQELFCALGATAALKESAVTGVFEDAPAVADPEDSERFRFPLPEHLRDRSDGDLEDRMEIRIARRTAGATRLPGELLFWARVPGRRATPAILGFLADMVPMSVVHASGHMGGGTSLDNTLRLGHPADTEWVLLQLDPHLALGGYGHGTGHLWSPDGVLMATASQTASLLILD
jgi:acyl-CoA thioesterase